MSLHGLLAPLLHPEFTLGSTPTSWAEVLGFVTGAINVWLVVRQNIVNWPVGIANVILLGLIFVDGGLYANASLQAVYVVLQAWGWWQWLYGGRGRTELVSRHTTRAEWAGQLVAGGVATVLYILFLALCVAGLVAWRREWAARQAASPVPAAA